MKVPSDRSAILEQSRILHYETNHVLASVTIIPAFIRTVDLQLDPGSPPTEVHRGRSKDPQLAVPCLTGPGENNIFFFFQPILLLSFHLIIIA